MQIALINLASEKARWQAALRQFHAVDLVPTRLEAVAGVALSREQSESLYSAELNGRGYHKAMRPGEIGCYASHLVAWRHLADSGSFAMAVFEDDIEIDADLPRVLDAVARVRVPWDIVKLIGRANESIHGRVRLLPGRDLIAYRRVPSLTGAYVITARGARKLLARRRPFGRPVDVDIRHWWECDLDVLGVYPYPVRGAPSSRVSTIEDRRAAGGLSGRSKKLWLQARYTFLNWRATHARAARSVPLGFEVERRSAMFGNWPAGHDGA